ncbi:MAG: hypothetical protein JWN57_42 [Frankiales bacterium]|nr:hypothetical protein [Frankiales bacterium]
MALLTAVAVGTQVLDPDPDCSLVVSGAVQDLSAEQAERVTTLAGVALRDGVPATRLAVAVRTARDGDTAGRAVDALARVPPAARPGAADLALARALLGHGSSRLSCAPDVPPASPEPEGPAGLTPRAARVLEQVDLVFGGPPVGGFAPGGVRTGHIAGSAHYEGRAVDVFFRPLTPDNRRRGWVAAQWAVAHASSLGLATVIFDRRIWTVAQASEGWRSYRVPAGGGDPAVRAHLDHVHIDVLPGRPSSAAGPRQRGRT